MLQEYIKVRRTIITVVKVRYGTITLHFAKKKGFFSPEKTTHLGNSNDYGTVTSKCNFAVSYFDHSINFTS